VNYFPAKVVHDNLRNTMCILLTRMCNSFTREFVNYSGNPYLWDKYCLPRLAYKHYNLIIYSISIVLRNSVINFC